MERNKKIKIPAGVDSGSRIRFDTYDVVLDVIPDKRFQREGADIITEEHISFARAALGTELPVETIHGQVKIRVPEGTQPDTLIRLRGKGIPYLRRQGQGDHYVRIKVTVPQKLSRKQKELLEEFEKVDEKGKGWF